MAAPSESLTDRLSRRRMTIVCGKGGVGKSTLVAAMAQALAARGARVLVVEPNAPHRLPGLLGGQVQGQLAPGIWGLLLEPEATMAAYLRSQLRVRIIAERIVRSHIYKRFAAAAPGLKELIVLGKIMMVYRGRHEVAGESGFDHVLLDAPATGHAIQLLRVPQLALDTFGDSPVTREAGRVRAMFEAPDTFIDVITLPEEMPVNEALELEQITRDVLGLKVGHLLVNGVVADLGSRGAAWAEEQKGEMSALVQGAVGAARWCASRRVVQDEQIRRAAAGTKAGMGCLSFVFDRDERRIVRDLAAQLEERFIPADQPTIGCSGGG